MADPAGKRYTGAGIDVFYEAKRCLHFAECVRGLPEVFDPSQRPWIRADNAEAERLAEVIRRCPSGALHYASEAVAPERPDQPTSVEPVPDGPLNLRGDLALQTPAGELRETRASLCRCGLTANQPFCDHECERSGWRSVAAESVRGEPR